MRGETARPIEEDLKQNIAAEDEAEDANGKTRAKETNGESRGDKKKHAQELEDQSRAQGRVDAAEQHTVSPAEASLEQKSVDRGKGRGHDLKDLEIEGKVYETPDKKYYAVGLVDLKKGKIEDLLAKLELSEKIKLPKDWDEKTTTQKRIWLREKGVELVPALAGGSGEEEEENWLEKLPKATEVSTELGRYIREIERGSKGARTFQDEYKKLSDVENLMTQAVLKGELPEDDAQVESVRSLLSDQLSDLVVQRVQAEEGMMRPGREGVARLDSEFEIPTKEATEKLLALAQEGETSGTEWDETFNKLDAHVKGIGELVSAPKPAEYKKAYLISKSIENAFYQSPDAVKLLPGEVRNRLKSVFDDGGLLSQLDRKFNSIFNSMDKKSQHALIGDIDSNSTTYLKMISAGWGETLESATGKLLGMIGEDPKGLREWRVYKHIDGLEQAVRVKQSTEVIPIWREIPEKLTTVFSQMESMDFSVEELSAATQEAIALVRSIAPDTPEGRNLRDDLVNQLEAFRAFHSMRITMERNDMNPERMLEVFQTYFDDETWEHFAERFSRDDRFREFVIEKTDEGGEKKLEGANVFDTAFSNYSERLRQERIKMNMVEELTRHAIENPLSSVEVSEIARSMNHTVDDNFKNQLEELRQYFVEKTRAYIKNPKNGIAGRSVDEVWGRKHQINGKKTIAITQELVQNWHNKHTLQGAFGFASEEDLADLMAEFGISDEKEARDRFLNKEFLLIRQEEMQEKLIAELKEMGLKIKVDRDTTQEIDVDILRESGFFDSVNKNAYFLTWMFEWSNYDGVRIYSRDTNSGLDDDFEGLVFHQNTNMFYGRHIDHIWEFYHDTNENRGRAKENDVNRIWKQKLPGKHHYLFPQNSVMVRWADSFMSEDQKKTLERRTREMMGRWDFDNEKYHDEFYSWMKNTALMDMIENGEVSFSSVDSGMKFSEVVKAGKIRKFEMIDVFVDRNKHLKYAGTDALQAYLANPTNTKFIEINDKTKTFYSTRAARQFPWMTLAYRAHWDVNSRHRQRLFDVPNINSTSAEDVADTLMTRGDMERKQTEHEKRKLLGFKSMKVGGAMGVPKIAEFETPGAFGAILGTAPLRRLRQGLEFGRKSAWEAKHVPLVLPLFALFGFIWGGFTEFLKQSVRQASGGQR